ncbi:DUF4349 domain-containing protein [Paenibacillus segetis]|uniref:DUF4349 domain-containing protein n=1 Tax=Paenibacillus segetis TaxID=1325360 RepID=A0ABQ1Y8I1_9BACL|nr:DUF4349 domain-containing protein [Paenibacillus segetis]GGH16419.1 hypothetical protein GCM10008013_11190 [Paenibacillus segetis]
MRRWGSFITVMVVALSLILGGCGSANKDMASESKANSGNMASSTSSDMLLNSTTTSNESLSAVAEAPSSDLGGESQVVDTSEAVASDRAGSGFQPSDSAAGLNKKLIYKANVVVEVNDYGKAQSEVRNLVTLSGGYILEFSESQSQDERGGTFVLKVPASGFSSFLDQLEKLKSVSQQRSIQGQDVSEEYVDLESRLKVKQAMEDRYLKFINEATKTSQLVEFANELERIQTEIEQIKGRMRYIDKNVSFSTIEIRLYQPEESIIKISKDDTPLMKRAEEALTGSLKVLSMFFQWIIVVLSGALPIIVIAAVIGVPWWLLRRRDNKHRHITTNQPPKSSLPELGEEETQGSKIDDSLNQDEHHPEKS